MTDSILFRSLQASYSLQGVISHLGSSPSSGGPALDILLFLLLRHANVFRHTSSTIPHAVVHGTTTCSKHYLCATGHFTADVLDTKGRWFRHNDALVQQIWPKADTGLQRSREETAYMLFYIANGL